VVVAGSEGLDFGERALLKMVNRPSSLEKIQSSPYNSHKPSLQGSIKPVLHKSMVKTPSVFKQGPVLQSSQRYQTPKNTSLESHVSTLKSQISLRKTKERKFKVNRAGDSDSLKQLDAGLCYFAKN
jgi:hypothetical protein